MHAGGEGRDYNKTLHGEERRWYMVDMSRDRYRQRNATPRDTD